jgi:hypothetical protein
MHKSCDNQPHISSLVCAEFPIMDTSAHHAESLRLSQGTTVLWGSVPKKFPYKGDGYVTRPVMGGILVVPSEDHCAEGHFDQKFPCQFEDHMTHAVMGRILAVS